MRRREFITGAVGAAALAGASSGWAQTRNEDKKSRISIMVMGIESQLADSMDRMMSNRGTSAPPPEKTIKIWDIGEFSADRYGIHNIELQSWHFASNEMSWLKDFRARLNKTKTRIQQINLEFMNEGLRGDTNTPASARLQMLDLHRVWLERAAFFGCPRVLVSQGSINEKKDIIISNLKTLVAMAKPLNIKIVCENHAGGAGARGGRGGNAEGRAGRSGGPDQRGGQAAETPAAAPPASPQPAGPPSYVLDTEILKAAGANTCCDWLNFDSEEAQHEGIRVMLPYTSGLVHAANKFDLHKAMAIAKELGYKGIYSIKAMGGTNPLDNTQKIMDVLIAEM